MIIAVPDGAEMSDPILIHDGSVRLVIIGVAPKSIYNLTVHPAAMLVGVFSVKSSLLASSTHLCKLDLLKSTVYDTEVELAAVVVSTGWETCPSLAIRIRSVGAVVLVVTDLVPKVKSPSEPAELSVQTYPISAGERFESAFLQPNPTVE